MMRCFLITICLLISFLGFSQEKNSIKPESVSFEVIEEPPVFPGCEKLDKELRRMCLQNQIGKHVADNFNANLANTVGLESGITRLYVVFMIAADGNVKDVKARGQHIVLENEGIRVISSLPQMTPGKQRGKSIGVKYTIPITLMVDEVEIEKSKN